VFASELTEDAGWFALATRRGGSISPYPNELQKYGIDAAVVNDYLAARSRVQHLCVLYTDCVGESASAGFEHFLTELNILHLMSIPQSQNQNGHKIKRTR
jgi:hypothetical protein